MPQFTELPSSFKKRFSALLGDEFKAFLGAISLPPQNFLRINTLKVSRKQALQRLSALGVEAVELPWFPDGFRIRGAIESIPLSREYALGYYYIQEGASMVPPIVLTPRSTNLVLDLCAAPGSKTTQIAQMMYNQGAIFANDRNVRRITSLGHNLQLCGVANTIVLCEDGRMLPSFMPVRFDRVLIDAPCTASGHLRSKPPQYDALDSDRLTGLQELQKGLLTAGFRLLKPGGLCVYSTCSLHPEENEYVVQRLISRFPDASIHKPKISGLKSHVGLTQWADHKFDDDMQKCLRIYPHDSDTDGFFLALIKKKRGGEIYEVTQKRGKSAATLQTDEIWAQDVWQFLSNQFGIPPLPGYNLLRSGKKRIRIVSNMAYTLVHQVPYASSVGLYLGEYKPHAVRLSMDGAQLLGSHATSQIMNLTNEQAKLWLQGQNIPVRSNRRGFVIVRHNNDILGCGSLSNGQLHSYVPKVRQPKTQRKSPKE